MGTHAHPKPYICLHVVTPRQTTDHCYLADELFPTLNSLIVNPHTARNGILNSAACFSKLTCLNILYIIYLLVDGSPPKLLIFACHCLDTGES